MSYLQKMGLGKASYDKFPCVQVPGHDHAACRGWEAACDRILDALRPLDIPNPVVAVDAYPGLHDAEVRTALSGGLSPALVIDTEKDFFKSETEINTLVAPDLGGDDPIFGRITRLTLDDFIDADRLSTIRKKIATQSGLTLIIGPGAAMIGEIDLLIYADMPRWEGQLRQRRGEVHNLGVGNCGEGGKPQYKRAFFIDWRVCDKWKRTLYDRWDFLLDTTVPNDPKLVTGDALRDGLREAASRPFRVVPFFDPGVWGGQWMREVCGLPDGPPNYAWCFDCVPEENSLLLGFGDIKVELPSINLVLRHPEELLGEPVYGRYGAEFPIRFDFLDTMDGQNLSFQVHPLIDYAYENFGLRYTQDESYYILDAEEDAEVYLGLRDDIQPEAMLSDLKKAAVDPESPFPDHKHVQRFPAKTHDHFLIPAGTCHCSGKNSMVLEISHTPYIFTFKMWDWGRVDLDGKPRPINLERGAANIQWNRTKSWVEPRLVNRIEPLATGDGWREERTGLYQSEAFETRRHWFTGTVHHDTRGDSVHVLNLVQGQEAVVESPSGAFEPYVVHYAETFIVPAAVGAYTLRPHGPAEGTECATIKAFLRVNA
jgi:mannose-6-phosphate isomerase class I